MRSFSRAGVVYTVTLEPEDTRIEGNVQASDNDADDRQQEKWVRDQLEAGNEAAWCRVKVTASLEIDGETFTGADYLGGVSYESVDACEKAMLGDDYDLTGEALDRLKESLEKIAAKGSAARKALTHLKASKAK